MKAWFWMSNAATLLYCLSSCTVWTFSVWVDFRGDWKLWPSSKHSRHVANGFDPTYPSGPFSESIFQKIISGCLGCPGKNTIIVHKNWPLNLRSSARGTGLEWTCPTECKGSSRIIRQARQCKVKPHFPRIGRNLDHIAEVVKGLQMFVVCTWRMHW